MEVRSLPFRYHHTLQGRQKAWPASCSDKWVCAIVAPLRPSKFSQGNRLGPCWQTISCILTAGHRLEPSNPKWRKVLPKRLSRYGRAELNGRDRQIQSTFETIHNGIVLHTKWKTFTYIWVSISCIISDIVRTNDILRHPMECNTKNPVECNTKKWQQFSQYRQIDIHFSHLTPSPPFIWPFPACSLLL